MESIKKAQTTYKHYYNVKTEQQNLKVEDMVLVRFPHEEQGKLRKLSRPWHGPYRVVSRDDPDVTVLKLYFPQEPVIQVLQIRVCPCPVAFPPGYYWYGRKQHSPGLPSWVENLIGSCVPAEPETESADSMEQPGLEETDILKPSCDDTDPEMWASEFEEVASCNADVTTVSPPEMEGADNKSRNTKTKYSLRRGVEPPKRLCGLSLETSSN